MYFAKLNFLIQCIFIYYQSDKSKIKAGMVLSILDRIEQIVAETILSNESEFSFSHNQLHTLFTW